MAAVEMRKQEKYHPSTWVSEVWGLQGPNINWGTELMWDKFSLSIFQWGVNSPEFNPFLCRREESSRCNTTPCPHAQRLWNIWYKRTDNSQIVTEKKERETIWCKDQATNHWEADQIEGLKKAGKSGQYETMN